MLLAIAARCAGPRPRSAGDGLQEPLRRRQQKPGEHTFHPRSGEPERHTQLGSNLAMADALMQISNDPRDKLLNCLKKPTAQLRGGGSKQNTLSVNLAWCDRLHVAHVEPSVMKGF